MQQLFKLSTESSAKKEILSNMRDGAKRLEERNSALYIEIETLRGEAGKVFIMHTLLS